MEDRRHRILARSSLQDDLQDPDPEQEEGPADKEDKKHLEAYLNYMTSAMNVLIKVRDHGAGKHFSFDQLRSGCMGTTDRHATAP